MPSDDERPSAALPMDRLPDEELVDLCREGVESAFTATYERHRKPRTSRIQAISSANTWMKGGNDDTAWLYGYDAWSAPLVDAPTPAHGA